VFGIDVSVCAHCGGAVRIVASIEESVAIRAILTHVEKHGALAQAHYRPAARAASYGVIGELGEPAVSPDAEAKSSSQVDAVTISQGRARLVVRNQREEATDRAPSGSRESRIPPAAPVPHPKTVLA
jgi:hypothetical protein